MQLSNLLLKQLKLTRKRCVACRQLVALGLYPISLLGDG
jgi:hypothetical protein